jgi:hypothetical protein
MGIRLERSPLHSCACAVAGGGDPRRGLRWQGELELAHEQLLIGVELGVAAENQCPPICRREVYVEHLDRRQFVEHGSSG